MVLYFIPKYVKPDKNFPVLSPEEVADLDNASSLSEQMKRLTVLLDMPPEELSKRLAACEEILQILRKFYPESTLLMYGSSVNSFGIRGCDMDLLFTPFPNYISTGNVVDKDKAEEKPIPDPTSVLSGEVSKDVLAKFDEPSHLKFIRTVMRREKIGKSSNFMSIHKRLFLKVFLKNNPFNCTISASNKLIAFNSELLQLYGKFDERVKPLVFCLIFWARSLGFIKKSFFTYDSFTLLVIFFLQSVDPPILPSVQHLMKISKSSRMLAGWQTAFCADVRRVPKSKNTLTIDELLAQFFDFYFYFDFSQNAVSPHSGRALPLKDIRNSKDKRMAEFQIKPLNIQDLFALSNNVSEIEKLAVFKLALLSASEMLKKKDKVKFSTLFNPDAYQLMLDVHYNRYIRGSKPQVCFIHFDNNCLQKFDSLQTWYVKAAEAVYDVLQCGLLMECEVTDKAGSVMTKERATSGSFNDKSKGSMNGKSKDTSQTPSIAKTSTPYDLQLLISIQCLMYSRVYVGRKKVEVGSLGSQNDLELQADSVLGVEHCISKTVIHKNALLQSSAPSLVFQVECYKHTNPELSDFIVMLKPVMGSKEFSQAFKFLASFLPAVVKKILISD